MTQTQNSDDDDEKLPTKLISLPGSNILEQEAPSHQAFYVEEGRAEVIMQDGDHTIKLGEIGPGEVFGEMGVINEENRIATVRAIEKCTVIVISRRELLEKINKLDDDMIKSLINGLTQRLKETTRERVRQYKNLALFQDRVTGIVTKANEGIDKDKREAFRAEAEPLLKQLENLLDKYKS